MGVTRTTDFTSLDLELCQHYLIGKAQKFRILGKTFNIFGFISV